MVTCAKSIKIFDLNHSQLTNTLKGDMGKIYSLLVIDHFLICAGDDEGRFKVWDYRMNGNCIMDLKECDDYISDLDVNSRKIVVASSGEGTLSAFNIR